MEVTAGLNPETKNSAQAEVLGAGCGLVAFEAEHGEIVPKQLPLCEHTPWARVGAL